MEVKSNMITKMTAFIPRVKGKSDLLPLSNLLTKANNGDGDRFHC